MQSTEITLTVGQTRIPAVLNGTRAAQDLISMLPYTVQLHKYVHDYCGVMTRALDYAPEDLDNIKEKGVISVTGLWEPGVEGTRVMDEAYTAGKNA